MVHSDLLRAGIPNGAPPGRKQLLQAHWKTLNELAGDREVWMPVFNYSFPRSQSLDVKSTVSEVGPLTEYFRTEIASWRTATPIFTFAGTGQAPPDDQGPEIDPFGNLSTYDHLVRADGVYLAYGATLREANPIHVAESQSGGPAYRYDKFFPGQVSLKDETQRQVVLRYRVRPWESGLDYDYPRLLCDLVNEGICQVWEPGPLRFLTFSAEVLIRYWTQRLAEDPLYLLDQATRNWVEPKLEELGRPFLLEDFEQSPVTGQ